MKTQTVSSDNKDAAYIATVTLFNHVSVMALNKICGWELESSYTNDSDKHFITRYTNGKIFIKAESVGDNHTYTLGLVDSIPEPESKTIH